MELDSERLILKELEWDDLETIHQLYSLPETDEYNTLGIPESIEKTEEIIQPIINAQKDTNRKLYYWKIIQKDSGELIGTSGITLSADRFRMGEISYELFPSYWGCGYATEAARLLIKIGFEKLHLHRIEAGVDTGNVRSIRVLEKSGMKREGVRRKILPIRGEWRDNYHYAILEDDPRD